MPKSSEATGDVGDHRLIQRHGSRGGSGTTGLTREALRRHNQLAFLQQEDAPGDMANILPPTLDPEGNVDIFRRSLLGSDNLGSVVSPSVATAHEGPKPEGALVLVGDPRDDKEDRVQERGRGLEDPPGGPAEGDTGVHRDAWPQQPDGEGGQVPGLH